MVDYLEGGRIPRSKYPRLTLDQLPLEDDILHLCKQKVDGTILYLLVVPNELRREALRYVHDRVGTSRAPQDSAQGGGIFLLV